MMMKRMSTAVCLHVCQPGVPAQLVPCHLRCPKLQNRGRIVLARGLDGTSQPSSGEGDKNLQESLVDVLQLEVAKARVREDIQKDVERRKESIRQIGQELTEEFEKKVELDKLRLELASGSSLADTMAQFKELDDEIQGIRDQLQADQADLDAFEARTASQRNDSLFFKQLYKGPEKPDSPSGAGAEAGSGNPLTDRKAVQQLTNNIKAPAVQEVHSPLRLYLFSYLSLVLLYVAAADVSSESVSPVQDTLYAVLAAGLGWIAWNERQALIQQLPKEEGRDPTKKD